MKAEIIAVGTELLLGNIVNTDAQIISQGLSELGIDVHYQTVVGDNPKRLREVVELAKSRADILITTGGLGPTLDDLTKETLAAAFGKKMVLHQPSLDKMLAFFREIRKEMTPNNAKQAWLPEGCEVLENDWGTAPGCAFSCKGKHVIMLPGPPRECTPMFQYRAMPYLYQFAGGCIVSRNVRVFGMGESVMETKLHDLMATSTNPTIAPYALTNECFARITAKADTEAQAEALLAPVVMQVSNMLGDAVYGVDVDSLEAVVAQELLSRGLTLSVAESCSGGLLSKRITDIAGCSAFYKGGVCSYANAVKENILGVNAQDLATYGAVSATVAEQMARGVCKALQTDVGVGITGIAGPEGGTAEKPVGTVFISVCVAGACDTKEVHISNGRDRVRNGAASTALDMIRRALLYKKQTAKTQIL